MGGRHLKIPSLSLLVLIGLMVMSASAAQAKWLLLLKSGISVLKQTFNITLNPLELLVPALDIKVFCKGGGTGTLTRELNGTHTTLSGSTSINLIDCFELKFKESCAVMGAGDSDGTISLSGSDIGSMEGENVFDVIESTQLADIQFLGEECPLTEVDCDVSGSITFKTSDPLTDAISHQGLIVKQNLFCGSNPAQVHSGAVGQGAVSGSIKTSTGETAATHLVGL